MGTEKDLFTEEQTMVAMSFGDHIEELRTRLILALAGLMFGVMLTFIPPLNLGAWVMQRLQDPAKIALKKFYDQRYKEKAQIALLAKKETPVIHARIPAKEFVGQLHRIAPKLDLPSEDELEGKDVILPLTYQESESIGIIQQVVEPPSALISLSPLETMTIFFMVCLVSGLVLTSPWVFYQAWAFVAAGLYRHEKSYVTRLLPMSLGLFLAGVFLCFFAVLPVTLGFLLEFNVWMGVEPTFSLGSWMSFATVLPLVFGLSFQTPLIMFFMERIGIFTVDDYRSKRKFAILIMVIAAAVLTPGPDVFSQLMLAVPMIGLYELGILMIGRSKSRSLATA